jgi:hypothetical protein
MERSVIDTDAEDVHDKLRKPADCDVLFRCF